jgi:hypothetical protein
VSINLEKARVQDDGVPLVASSPRVGSEVVVASHNFCDKTTWFSNSSRETDHSMVDSGDGLRWTSGHIDWIDMVSGRIHNQEKFSAYVEHGYSVVVKVDGVEKSACPPFKFASSDGDYWIDYDAGEINFFVSQSGKTVTASFSYAVNSEYVLAPKAGKILRIEDAETDFSNDIVLNTSFGYIVKGYVDAFAPHMVRGASTEHNPVLDKDLSTPPSSPVLGDRYVVAASATGDWSTYDGHIAEWGGSAWVFTAPDEEEWVTVIDEISTGPYYTWRGGQWAFTLPAGTKIPIQEDYYHRVSQIIAEARGAHPSVIAVGASQTHKALTDIKEFRRKSRGMRCGVQAIPFRYGTARDLHSAYGMELVVSLVDDTNSLEGESLTITFYCTSMSEA